MPVELTEPTGSAELDLLQASDTAVAEVGGATPQRHYQIVTCHHLLCMPSGLRDTDGNTTGNWRQIVGTKM